MIKKLWNWLTDKDENIKDVETEINGCYTNNYISPEWLNDEEAFSFDDIDEPEIIDNGKDRSILFMDDLESQFDLYSIDFRRIKNHYDFDINDHYNIINCRGDFAGFIAWKYLQENKVNLAVLDITLGKSVKLENGTYLAYDGIDIGLELERNHPSTFYKFCTAHPLNRKNKEIHSFINKYESESGNEINDFYFNKNDERHVIIYKMIEKDLNKEKLKDE